MAKTTRARARAQARARGTGRAGSKPGAARPAGRRAAGRTARAFAPGRLTRSRFGWFAGMLVAGALLGAGAGLLLGGGADPDRQVAAPSSAADQPAAPAQPETRADTAPATGSAEARPATAPTQAPRRPEAPPPASTAPADRTPPRAAEAPAATPPAATPPAAGPSAAPAWRRHAVAVPAMAPGTPKLAIVIDDLGLDRANARATVALPGPLTLAVLTYAPSPGDLTDAVRAAGHELLVHLPMQPSGPADPGPRALQTGLSADELQRRLDWGLSRFDGFVGVNNHMGSAFTRDAPGMRRVLADLKRRGLLFLDSRTTAETVGARLARELGVAHAERDVFLDNDRDPAAIRAQLDKAEALAREQGAAIAIGHPHDATIQVLRARLPGLKARGVALVPVSQLVRTGPSGEDLAELPE